MAGLKWGGSRRGRRWGNSVGRDAHGIRPHLQAERMAIVLNNLVWPVYQGIQLVASPALFDLHADIGFSSFPDVGIPLAHYASVIGPLIPCLGHAEFSVGLEAESPKSLQEILFLGCGC